MTSIPSVAEYLVAYHNHRPLNKGGLYMVRQAIIGRVYEQMCTDPWETSIEIDIDEYVDIKTLEALREEIEDLDWNYEYRRANGRPTIKLWTSRPR